MPARALLVPSPHMVNSAKAVKEYTLCWFIENYSYCWHRIGEKLVSPYITVDGLEGTAWNLELYPSGDEDKDKGHISLYLNRSASDDGPVRIWVEYTLSILAADGSTLKPWRGASMFEKGNGCGFGNFKKTEEILLQRNDDNLSQDTLTVRCKIRKGEGNVVHHIGQCSTRTRIKVVKTTFLHDVEGFSTMEPNQKKTMEIQSNSKEKRFLCSSLYYKEGICCGEKIWIEIVPSEEDQILSKLELSLLDIGKKAIECGKADYRYDAERKSMRVLPLSLTREEILGKKSEYLPHDKLSLLCECTFSSGLEFETVEETQHGISTVAVKRTMRQVSNINVDTIVEKPSLHPSALEDIKDLYTNQCLTDVELKTNTKSFPAHKIILSARSPVFKTMLTSDMKEKHQNCIQIDDLEADVVEQMLLFLYSDKTEKLQWEMATRLYFAADKYQISKLKEVCSSYLLANLTTSTVGKILVLSDTHSDLDLKKSVEDFILKHEDEVFESEEWEKWMKTNPLLFLEAMHLKYKRKKKIKTSGS